MANPFGVSGTWDYGASASKASKNKHNALYVPKETSHEKALGKKVSPTMKSFARNHEKKTGEKIKNRHEY